MADEGGHSMSGRLRELIMKRCFTHAAAQAATDGDRGAA
jgi:hypothetical protein